MGGWSGVMGGGGSCRSRSEGTEAVAVAEVVAVEAGGTEAVAVAEVVAVEAGGTEAVAAVGLVLLTFFASLCCLCGLSTD